MMATTQQEQPLLRVEGLSKYFPVRRLLGGKRGKTIKAVHNVSFSLYRGETYGLVGESGCGKSTLGRLVLQLMRPSAGTIALNGQNVLELSGEARRALRRHMQMVFQDPFSSLNPRHRIGGMLEEILAIHRIGTRTERTARVLDMLRQVGLQSEHYYSYPHEFSGGQRQRIGLARALLLRPQIVVCDEPVSALDVIIQSQIINLLRKLQSQFQLAYLFIAHDLSVVRHISDRIGVMYLGQLVEEAPTDELFAQPLHPYTRALLSAVPKADPTVRRDRIRLVGEVPSALNPPAGCAFHPRCPQATEQCRINAPELREAAPGRFVSCHLYDGGGPGPQEAKGESPWGQKNA